MFKKLSLFAFAVAATAGVALSANLGGILDQGGQFRVFGQYLYLLPSIDDSSFVIDSPITTTFPNGKRKHNDVDFHSGFRVGGGYTFCGCSSEVNVAYTQLQFTEKRNIAGDFLWATVGRPDLTSSFENYAGVASSRLKFLYERFDGLFSQEIINNCCGLNVAVQFGIEAAQLRLKERYVYDSETNLGIVHQYSRAKGVGPQIGFAFDYELYTFCGCMPGKLSLNVLSSASLLAANNRTKVSNVLNDEDVLSVKNSKSWRVIPALHASIGLNYDLKVASYDTAIEVGYEFSSYLRGLTRLSFPDDVADALSNNYYDNFDVQGLYVSASFRF